MHRVPVKLLGFVEPQRAALETSALFATLPPLLAGPKPDGHPVLVVPGLSGGAKWCAILRAYLTALGHNVHQPRRGATKGPVKTVVGRLVSQVEALERTSGAQVSVVGWSVGGCIARQVGILALPNVRRVITLGAPVGGFWYREIPGTGDVTMPVPTTAIYSKSDPWFHWRTCQQKSGDQCENIAIPSSHLGMATNAFAYHAIADRLALRVGHFHPYQPPRFLPVQAAPSNGGMSL